jgi:hypothetical protein
MSQAGDKLAATRRAIIEHAQRKDRRRESAEEFAQREPGAADGPPDDADGGWFEGLGGFGGLGHAVKAWWRPVLSAYARRKPLQFLGIAAAAGAVVVVARPWKLISATGLLMAVLKSSQVTGLVLSAMSAARYGQEPDRPE